MTASDAYEPVYAPVVQAHLAKIERKYRSLIRRAIADQLRFEPEGETKNRKPLQRPSMLGTVWELRCGPDNWFRVFYRADRDARQVHILAIGVKIKDRLVVGGEEFDL